MAIQKILLVVDDWDTAEAAAEYSARLAAVRRAELAILVCINDPLIELNRYIGFDNVDEIRQQLQEEAERRGRSLLAGLPGEAREPDVAVCWSSSPHKNIIEHARRHEAVLIVKHVGYHSLLAEFIHTPDDWQLLRYAECPVLMLGARPRPPAFVVAAIDGLDKRPEHQTLSARILDEAHAMARSYNVPLRAVAVCPDPGLSYSLAGTLPSYLELSERLYEQARQGLEETVQRFGVPCDELQVLRGMVDRQLAAAVGNDGLLVIGGCSNRGLKGRLLGNVAERVLHYVDGNVLVVA